MDKKVGNIESKVNDLKNELLLPEDIKEEKEFEITTLQNELRAYQSKKFGVGGDLFKRRKELIQPIQRKVFKAIESLAKIIIIVLYLIKVKIQISCTQIQSMIKVMLLLEN